MSKPTPVSDKEVARAVRALILFRKRNKLSQQAVADIIGIPRYRISNLENGKEQMSRKTYMAIIGMFACMSSDNTFIDYLETHNYLWSSSLEELNSMLFGSSDVMN